MSSRLRRSVMLAEPVPGGDPIVAVAVADRGIAGGDIAVQFKLRKVKAYWFTLPAQVTQPAPSTD